MAPGPLRLAAPFVALVLLAALIGIVVIRPAPDVAAGARILSGPDLLRVLQDTRARNTTLDVIADVAIDGGQRPPSEDRECTPPGRCRVVGVLAGFEPTDGVVVVRDVAQVAPPRTTADDLAAPVALRLGPGPIEFLGHYAGSADDRVLRVPQALGATERTANGHVLVVEGWLTRRPMASCGPYPGPAAIAPFTCAIRDYIAATRQATPGNAVPAPSDALAVQRGAFQQFVWETAESSDSVFGTFLVRHVITTATGCAPCRGWLVVGRMDAEPQPLPPSVVTVMAPGQLAAALAADRAAWSGRVVFVDGQIDPGTCQIAGACVIGVLVGTDEEVTATAFTSEQMLTGGPSTDGILALRVRDRGLEYLGLAGNGADLLWPNAALADPSLQNNAPLVIAVAQGWLIVAGGMTCPHPAIEAPEDTPFRCPFAWVTATETREPWNTDVRVQPEAYLDYAPDPTYDGGGGGGGYSVPRFGTYVLRLVTDLRPGSERRNGWQVIGRLAP